MKILQVDNLSKKYGDLSQLMLAKTFGAIVFGIINAFIPIIMAGFLMDLSTPLLNILVLAGFTIFLFAISIRNIKVKWIY